MGTEGIKLGLLMLLCLYTRPLHATYEGSKSQFSGLQNQASPQESLIQSTARHVRTAKGCLQNAQAALLWSYHMSCLQNYGTALRSHHTCPEC